MLAAALQRVLVEEQRAIERQAGNRAVVKRLLHHVGVARVGAHSQHPVRPEDQADGGAGLRVGGLIRQVVVRRETFVGGGRAEAAGDVEALGHEIVPQPVERDAQRIVAILSRDVGHAGIEIHGANRVAHDLVLLANRLVRLVVLVGLEMEVLWVGATRPRLLVEIVRLMAALVDEVLCQVHIFLLAGDTGQLDQRQFDLLMAAIAALLAGLGCRTYPTMWST